MNKFLKISLTCLIIFPLLALITLVLFLQFQDANRYKQSIEEQAKKHVGIDLAIDGNLAWSIFPLGLDINEIKVNDQTGETFATAKQILAQIDLLSLLKASPNIHTLLLDGVQLSLVEDKKGYANWQNIVPKNEPGIKPNEKAPVEGKQERNKDGDGDGELSFLLSNLLVSNLAVHYESELKKQKIYLEPLNLEISDITPDHDFPVTLSFEFEDVVQQLALETKVSSMVNFSSDFSRIQLKNLSSEFLASGKFSESKEVNAKINGQISINTKNEEISIPELTVKLEEIVLASQLRITDYSNNLSVLGDIKVNTFNPTEIARTFNVPLPKMSNPDSMQAFSLESSFSLEESLLKVSQLLIQLDQSSWQGTVDFNTSNQALVAAIEGDTFNLDHYLPTPEDSDDSKQEANTRSDNKEQAISNNTSDLLPLELIRKLDLDLSFKQQELIAKKILVENIAIQVSASKGLISLKDLSAKTHDGEFVTSATLDARSDKPTWKADSSITDLNLGSLIKAMELQKADSDISLSGKLNFNTQLSSTGNRLDLIQQSALAQTHFDLVDGELLGINLKALNCKGLSLINRESLDTSEWPKSTPFETLKGEATLSKQNIATGFDIISSGLHANAQGPINLESQSIDIRLALNVTGDSETNACRVNEKFTGIPIPVRCKGTFDTPPGKLCKLDSVRLREAAKEAAVKEGKRKLEKELDRSLEKHLGDKAELKDAAKGLLKKLF